MASIKSYIKEYRPLWLKCKNNKERHILRERFFNLKFNEDTLEKGWDSVTLGVKYIPRPYNRKKPKIEKSLLKKAKEIERIRREVFNEIYD